MLSQLSSVAISYQKGRSGVNKCFMWLISTSKQSRRTNDNGSLLGPVLANIFVGYYKEKLFSQMHKPLTYFRYFDDTFSIFDPEAKTNQFLIKFNCLHPSLKSTFEKEKRKCLPFLDVYVKRTDIGFETSIYTGNPLSLASVYVGSP